MSIHQSIRTMSREALDAMLIRFIGGEPDTSVFTRKEWLSAAGQAYDGDRTDLDAFHAETDAYHTGEWAEREARASESYVPISSERPCAALYGSYRA